MKKDKFFKLLVALGLTTISAMSFAGCGPQSSGGGNKNPGGTEPGSEEQHSVSFKVKNDAVVYIKNQSYGDVDLDDVTLPANARAISVEMSSFDYIRKLTIPKNIEQIVDNDGIPCDDDYLRQCFRFDFAGGAPEEIIVQAGNPTFAMKNGCLYYNDILLVATQSATQTKTMEIGSNIAQSAFDGFNFDELKLYNLIINFDKFDTENHALQNFISELSDRNIVLPNLTINVNAKEYSQNNFTFNADRLRVQNLVVNGDAYINLSLASAQSIAFSEGVTGYSVKMYEQSDTLNIAVPSTLNSSSNVYCGSHINFQLNCSHYEFCENQIYALMGLDESVSYKNIGLMDRVETENNSSIIFEKSPTNQERLMAKVYKNFYIKYTEIEDEYGNMKEVVELVGYFGTDDEELYIPDKVEGKEVIRIGFTKSELYTGYGYKQPNITSFAKLSLPKTIKYVDYEEGGEDYAFGEIEYRGTTTECKTIKSQLSKLLQYAGNGSLIRCSDGDIKFGSVVTINSTYSFEVDGVSYTMNADWANNNFEISYVGTYNGKQKQGKVHFISDDKNRYIFDNNDLEKDERGKLVIYDFKLYDKTGNNFDIVELYLSRVMAYDEELDVNYFDLSMGVGKDYYIPATSRLAYNGSIEHEWEEIIDITPSCSQAGQKHTGCKYCDASQDDYTEIAKLDHNMIANIGSNFGHCEHCNEYLLGSFDRSQGTLTFAKNDGYQNYRNEITTLVLPADSKYDKFVFENNSSELFPNLQNVYVDSLDDWFKCSFSSALQNPLSKGLSLNIKNDNNEYVPLTSLDINLSDYTDSNSNVCLDYMFYGCTSITSINLYTSSYSYAYVQSGTFANMPNLDSINISSGNVRFYEGAFAGCTSITTIENISTANDSTISEILALNPNAKIKNLTVSDSSVDGSKYGRVDNVYIRSSSCTITSPFNATAFYVDSLDDWFRATLSDSCARFSNNNFSLYAKNDENYERVQGTVNLPARESFGKGAFSFEGITHLVFQSYYWRYAVTDANAFAYDIPQITAPVSLVKYLTFNTDILNISADTAGTISTVLEGMRQSTYGETNTLTSTFKEVRLDSSIDSISANTFAGKTALTKINLNNVKNIYSNAFKDSGIREVGSSNKVTVVGTSAFENCTKLATFDLSSVNSVADNAFKNCSLLVVGDLGNIKSIGKYAFAGIGKLEGVLDLSLVTSCDATSFEGAKIEEVVFNEYNESFGIIPLKKLTIKSCNNTLDLSSISVEGLELHLPSMSNTRVSGGNGLNWKVYFEGSINDFASVNWSDKFGSIYLNNNILSDITIENVDKIGTIFSNSNITSLTIKNAKTISSYAFQNCRLLTNVNIENTSTSKVSLNYTFKDCVALDTVKLSGQFGLDSQVFDGCGDLTTLSIPLATKTSGTATSVFGSLGTVQNLTLSSDLINSLNSETNLSLNVVNLNIEKYVATTLDNFGVSVSGDVTIGEGITSVSGLGKSVLSSVTFPSSITSVKISSTFADESTIFNYNCDLNTYVQINQNIDVSFNCARIVKIKNGETYENIPNVISLTNVTSIAPNAFRNVTNITSLTIPDTCVSLGENALKGMSALVTLSIPSGCSYYNNNYSSASVFAGLDSLQSLSLPSQGIAISSLFGGNIPNNLKTINIVSWSQNSNGNKYIPVYMFSGVGASISFDSDYAEISIEAFKNSSLSTISLPSTLISIGDSAFEGCTLSTITIPDNCTSIGKYAFKNCAMLESVIFDGFSKAKTFGVSAFNGAQSIKNTQIITSDNTLSIGKTKWLTSVFKSNNVNDLLTGDCNPTYFSKNLILNGQEVTDITYTSDMGEVAKVSSFAFVNVASIKTINLSNASQIGNFAFYNCDKMESLKVNLTGEISGYAFAMDEDKTSVLKKVDIHCGALLMSNALQNHTSEITEAYVGNENYGDFDNLLQGATKLWKAEIASKTGYNFDNTFTNLQYVTFKVFETKTMSMSGSRRVVSPNIKSISFVGGGNLSIGSGVFADVNKLYRLQFGNMTSSSSNLQISSINSYAFTNCAKNLYELFNSTSTNMSSLSFYTSENYATSASSSLLVVEKNWENVYFKHTFDSDEYYELVDFREDNKTSYAFKDTVTSVISEWDGNTVSLGKIKVVGDRLFGKKYLKDNNYVARNSTITDITISPRIASETNFNCVFGSINTATYEEGTTSIVGFGSTYGDGDSSIKSIVLPSTLKSIGANAFKGCGTSLESVTFNNNSTSAIETIGNSAFEGCLHLTNVDNIIVNATSIGDSAFAKTGITSLSIPSTITSIPKNAFFECKSLANVSGFDHITSMYRDAFNGTALSSVSLGDLTVYSKTAFNNCANLTSFHFGSLPYGSSVDDASAKWFEGCTALSTITSTADGTASGLYAKANTLYSKNTADNSSVLVRATNGTKFYENGNVIVEFGTISEYAFSWLNGSVKEFTFPASLTKIENNAFYKSVVEKLVFDNVKSIGNSAFSGSNIAVITNTSDLTYGGIKFGESLTELGNAAFYNCKNITSVVLPSSLKSLDGNTFKNSNITSIDLGGVTKIYLNAFENCSLLSSISIPNTVTEISQEAFKNSGLSSITFASDAKIGTIEKSVFEGTSLVSITLPDSVSTISTDAFKDCLLLESVTANNIIDIKSFAFNNCTKLASFVSSTLQVLNDDAFNGCGELTSIDLSKVQTIGARALKGTAIKSADFSSVRSIGESAFENANDLLSYTLNSNTSWTSVGARAFKNTGLKGTIILGDRLATIGENIFEGVVGVNKFVTPYLSKDNAHYSLSYFFGSAPNSLDTLQITGIYSGTGYVNTTLDYADLDDTNINKLILSQYVKNIVDTGTTKYIRQNDENKYVHTFQELRYEGNIIAWVQVKHEISDAPAQITENIYCGNTLMDGEVSITGSNVKIAKGKFYKYNKNLVLTLSGVEVEESAFEGSSISSLTVSDSTIYARAFRDTKLTSLVCIGTTFENKTTSSDTLKTEKGSQFADNTLLRSIQINLKGFNSTYAFENCPLLATVTFSDEQSQYGFEIQEGTFINCRSIESLTLPKNVSYIGKYAFKNDTGLKDVTVRFDVLKLNSNSYLQDAPLYIKTQAFENCTSLQTLTFDGVWGYVDPSGVNNKAHTKWRYDGYYLTREGEYPDTYSSLIAFGDKAFLNCTNLKKVNYLVTTVSSTGYKIYKPSGDVLWAQNFFEFYAGNAQDGSSNYDKYYSYLNKMPLTDQDIQDRLSANPLAYGGLLYIKESNGSSATKAVTEITEQNYSGHTEWAGSGITKVNIAGETCENDSLFAFTNCKSLTSFTSKNLYNLGTKLKGCTALEGITLTPTQIAKGVKIKTYSDGNYIVYQTDSSYDNKTCLWYVKGDTYDDTDLGINVIQRFAFANSQVTNVTLHSVSVINVNAFAYSKVESLTLMSSSNFAIDPAKYDSTPSVPTSSISVENGSVTLNGDNYTLSILKDVRKIFTTYSTNGFTYHVWL